MRPATGAPTWFDDKSNLEGTNCAGLLLLKSSDASAKSTVRRRTGGNSGYFYSCRPKWRSQLSLQTDLSTACSGSLFSYGSSQQIIYRRTGGFSKGNHTNAPAQTCTATVRGGDARLM